MGYIHPPLRLYSNNNLPGKQQKNPVLLPFSERCWILRSPTASLRGGGTCKQLTWTTKPRQWELQRYSHYLKRGEKQHLLKTPYNKSNLGKLECNLNLEKKTSRLFWIIFAGCKIRDRGGKHECDNCKTPWSHGITTMQKTHGAGNRKMQSSYFWGDNTYFIKLENLEFSGVFFRSSFSQQTNMLRR